MLLPGYPGEVPRMAESEIRHTRRLRAAGRMYRFPVAEAVTVPGAAPGGYPDWLDWLAFRRDDAIRLLRWRTELIRRLDKRNKITAHSTGLLTEIEWRTAANVDSYGYTRG